MQCAAYEDVYEDVYDCDGRRLDLPDPVDPVTWNILADAIATGDTIEALRMLHTIAGDHIPSPGCVIARCRVRGWNVNVADETTTDKAPVGGKEV